MVFQGGDSFFDKVLGILAAIIYSAIFFGLAVILDKQDEIKKQFSAMQTQSNAVFEKVIGANVCEKCGKEFDHDFTNCPHCGGKK